MERVFRKLRDFGKYLTRLTGWNALGWLIFFAIVFVLFTKGDKGNQILLLQARDAAYDMVGRWMSKRETEFIKEKIDNQREKDSEGLYHPEKKAAAFQLKPGGWTVEEAVEGGYNDLMAVQEARGLTLITKPSERLAARFDGTLSCVQFHYYKRIEKPALFEKTVEAYQIAFNNKARENRKTFAECGLSTEAVRFQDNAGRGITFMNGAVGRMEEFVNEAHVQEITIKAQ